MTDQTKKPRLFYWEDAVDAWVPATDEMIQAVSQVLPELSQLEPGETHTISFRREDMTDEEFDNIPEG